MNVTFFKTADADLARKLLKHLDATSETPIGYDADGAVIIFKCVPNQSHRLQVYAEGFAACHEMDNPRELQAALPKGFVDNDHDGLG